MWNLLKVLPIFAPQWIFWSKYLPVWENEYLHANLCEYFEANMKRLMWINNVGEYTETCEYEAN
jgi:hypothetical protein